MSSRRSRFEIYIDILAQIKSGETLPTRIMYGVNLSWKNLQSTLQSLINQGLIEEFNENEGDNRSKKFYRITEKGDNVLKYFNRIESLMELNLTSTSEYLYRKY